MDNDKLSLFARKLCMSERKLTDIIKELIKRNLFNNDLYISSSILTNDSSESGKELVIAKRQSKKNYIANKRKETNVEFYNGNVVNKDIFINKIIVYDNDDMVIIYNTTNNQIDIKKESLNQEFIFHSFGGPNFSVCEHLNTIKVEKDFFCIHSPYICFNT